MNVMREFPVSVSPRPPRRLARRGLVLLAAMGLVVSACSSGDEQSSSVAGAQENLTKATAPSDVEVMPTVAGAVENAVVSGEVCRDWPNGTTVVPCAVGVMGPGGGRVFYDAGGEQPWGRFLEVAPQDWGGTLYGCGQCGAAPGVEYKTSDLRKGWGAYRLCRDDSRALLLPGEAADTLWEIGGGRRNTEVLLQAAGCVDGTTSALQQVTEYRTRTGRSDWYLPSGGELTELCKYTGRDAIGGFTNASYQSSTVGPTKVSGMGDVTDPFLVQFYGRRFCDRVDALNSNNEWYGGAVRPIRAFA